MTLLHCKINNILCSCLLVLCLRLNVDNTPVITPKCEDFVDSWDSSYVTQGSLQVASGKIRSLFIEIIYVAPLTVDNSEALPTTAWPNRTVWR